MTRRKLRKKPLLKKKESNTQKKKKNLQLQKTPLPEQKLIIQVIKISLNVYSVAVIIDILFFFFAVFKLVLCFRQKKYTNYTESKPTFKPKKYIIRKTYNLFFARILQAEADTWQNSKMKKKVVERWTKMLYLLVKYQLNH